MARQYGRLASSIVLAFIVLASPLLVTLKTEPVSAAVANGKIVFETNRDGNDEIYVMNADGSGQTNLTNNAADDTSPSWSPDGSRLVFISYRDGDGSAGEVYVMNPDGSGLTNLTNSAASEYSPVWSPDGSKIAFNSNRDGNNEIYVMNADGTGQKNLTNNPALESTSIWTPDSDKIIFKSNRDNPSSEIYSMNADGSGVLRLTTDGAGSSSPLVSPDGTTIVFQSWRNGYGEVYSMALDGSNQTQLTTNVVSEDYPIDFSPDGLRIVYQSYDSTYSSVGIYTMSLDGGFKEPLISISAGIYNTFGSWAAVVAGSANTAISASVSSVISLSTSSTVSLSVTPSGGVRVSSTSDTVSVSTNHAAGYTLSLSNQDTNTNLRNGANSIAAHSGSLASPTNLVANRWGFRVDGIGGFGAGPTTVETNASSSAFSWAGVPSSAAPVQLKSTGSTATNDTTIVWYGVMVDSTIPNGSYSDTVSYTAVTN